MKNPKIYFNSLTTKGKVVLVTAGLTGVITAVAFGFGGCSNKKNNANNEVTPTQTVTLTNNEVKATPTVAPTSTPTPTQAPKAEVKNEVTPTVEPTIVPEETNENAELISRYEELKAILSSQFVTLEEYQNTYVDFTDEIVGKLTFSEDTTEVTDEKQKQNYRAMSTFTYLVNEDRLKTETKKDIYSDEMIAATANERSLDTMAFLNLYARNFITPILTGETDKLPRLSLAAANETDRAALDAFDNMVLDLAARNVEEMKPVIDEFFDITYEHSSASPEQQLYLNASKYVRYAIDTIYGPVFGIVSGQIGYDRTITIEGKEVKINDIISAYPTTRSNPDVMCNEDLDTKTYNLH